jgi:hypothetical protein
VADDQATYQHYARGPANYGPIRSVFAKPWALVVGTGTNTGTGADTSSPVEGGDVAAAGAAVAATNVAFARYIANSHFGAVGTEVPIYLDSDGWVASRPVVVGTLQSNSWFRNLTNVADWERTLFPFELLDDQINMHTHGNDCSFYGAGLGLVSIVPQPNGEVGLVVTGTDTDGIQALVSQLFSSQQSLTRPAFTNMLPDFMLIDAAEFRRYGYGGVLAAGYYTNNWLVSDASAYTSCQQNG